MAKILHLRNMETQCAASFDFRDVTHIHIVELYGILRKNFRKVKGITNLYVYINFLLNFIDILTDVLELSLLY
jgi:hypothetical protein